MRLLQKEFRGRLYTYFRSKLGMFDYKNGWMKGDCPSCGKTLKFGVNLYQDRSNCFSCLHNAKPIDIVVSLEGLKDRNSAYIFLRSFENVPYLENRVEELIQKPAFLPEGFKLLSMGKNMIAQSARSYMEDRGFDIKELSLQGVGYCDRGDYKYRIILPFYEGGKLVYFNARQFIDLGPKFKNPPLEDFGIGKNLLIYNIDALAHYNKIYLVESVTNALTMGNNAIAIGGKILSQYQASKLLNSGVRQIVVILDNDATEYAIKIGLKLGLHKKVKVVLMPDDRDVNDRGKKFVKKLERKAEFGDHGHFMKMKFNYERSLNTY